MNDPDITMLTIFILGQICLSVPLLLLRGIKSNVYLPLAAFLFANGILALNAIISATLPDWYLIYTAVAFPMLFTLNPSLRLYVEGITNDLSWKLTRLHARHYILLCPSIVISVMIIALPKELHTALFIDNADVNDPLAIALALSILVMIVLWLGQCLFTVHFVIGHLKEHRSQLKHLFSNYEERKLNWLSWLVFLALIVWFLTLLTVFTSNLFEHWLFSEKTEALLALLLIWSLSHFGLHQMPGKSELGTHKDKILVLARNSTKDNEELPQKKYKRSALSTEQSSRIASKINAAMEKSELYLDADLSLQKLAKTLGISPNYISQTLNETLNSSFFDYVNHWRIKAAKPLVLANQETILHIALEVGFNARSSFYKAFKQETGTTPSGFRKHHAQLEYAE